jgi:leucyl-tRNA synthetase
MRPSSDCKSFHMVTARRNSNGPRYTLKEWCEEIIKDADAGKLRSGPKDTFWDKIFENEMNELIEATKEHYDRYVDASESRAVLLIFAAPRTSSL